jgi:bifunctional non-homologous end joining protein LigD
VAARQGGEQLSLSIDPQSIVGLPAVRPMLPLAADAPFDDPDWFFEPWWPGASVLLYVDGDVLRLQTEHLADPLHAFPELAPIGRQFADGGLIVEGALLVLDKEGRPDSDLLRRRLAGEASDLSGQAAIVASDLLYERGRPLLGLPFERRRQQLADQLTDGERCVISRGLRGEGLMLAEALASMGLHEISARLLAGRYRPGQQDTGWLRLPVSETPAPRTRPLLAVLQRLPL